MFFHLFQFLLFLFYLFLLFLNSIISILFIIIAVIVVNNGVTRCISQRSVNTHYIINVGVETIYKYILFDSLSTTPLRLRLYLLLILKLVGLSLLFTDSSNRIFLPTGTRISI